MVPPGTLTRRDAAAPHATTAAFDAAVALQLTGDVAGAEQAWRRFLITAPRHAAAHNNLGACLAARGERGAALACFATAAELDPAYGDAFHNFGLVLAGLGQHADAVGPLARAASLEPARAPWWADLATAHAGAGQQPEAVAAYERALALAPDDPAILLAMASPLRALGRAADALAAVERVLAQAPRAAAAWANLGILRRELGDLPGSLAALERAQALDPALPLGVAELAKTLVALGRRDAARRAAEWLSAEQPHLPEAWNTLGAVAFEQGDYDVAEAAYRATLTLRPGDVTAEWNRALLELLRGDLAAGFAQFEVRTQMKVAGDAPRADLPPAWDGRPLAGERLLVLAEQGLGDLVQFARFVPALKALGAGHVTLECPPTLAPLIAALPGVDALVPPGAPCPAADRHVRLLSLAHHLRITLEGIPLGAGYLEAPARPVAARVRALAGPRVAIAWAGNPKHTRDRVRSLAFDALAPLLAVPGVSFVSLQQGAAREALAAAPQVLDLGPALADLGDAAAAIAACDLVITVDSALAHLAGALGVPTWTLLPAVPDWRWRLEATDTPWYDAMRLVRQPALDAWAPVVQGVARALGDVVAGADPRTVAMAVAPDAAHERAPAVRLSTVTRLAHVSAPTPATIAAVAAQLAPRTPVVIGWPVGTPSGWGTYGFHLAQALARSPRVAPVLAAAPELASLEAEDAQAIARLPRVADGAAPEGAVHLTALGTALTGGAPSFTAARNAGLFFLEDTALDAATARRARGYDVLVAGSDWNAELVAAATGHPHVVRVWQGVDPVRFQPRPRSHRLADRFVVFSGGKLEYRKGQDLVIAAFRRFRERHPEALLVTAWHNLWPETLRGVDAMGHVQGLPSIEGGRLQLVPWLVANGIPAEAVHDLGPVTAAEVAHALRACDVALFPNRAEGGTNLVAMEAMACGVPAIIAANTGQRDLLTAGGAIALERQGAVRAVAPYRGTAGWGESDVDEIVDALERVHADRDAARAIGLAGAAHVGAWTWARQVDHLLDAIA